jgi:hypothetical protein
MTVLAEYREARRGEDLARLRRVIALRAMLADGMSQQAVADELGVSVPDREGVIVRVLDRVPEPVTVIDGVSVIAAEELNEMEDVPVTDGVPVDVDVVEGVIVSEAVWDAVPVEETLGVWDDVVEEEMVAEAV